MFDDTKPSNEAARQFLLAEYARFSEAFWRNEETGETRVNWFIGIVTAGLGGLVALITTTDSQLAREYLQAIVLAGLVALLVFGLVTFARMITRNRQTDQYKHALDIIRQKFQDYFDGEQVLGDYYPVGGPWKSKDERPKRKLGGLTHIVAAINSVVMAALFVVALYPTYSAGLNDKTRFLLATTILGLAVLFVAFEIQRWWADTQDKATKDVVYGTKLRAGGVVFRISDKGRPEYLVIHPYRDQTAEQIKNGEQKQIDTSEWVLPKGKIWTGESHGDAALREVREEAGVRARIVCPLGVIEYEVTQGGKKKDMRVKFYLMEKVYQEEKPDPRRPDFDDALKKLPKELKEVLKRDPQWRKYKDAFGALSHEESKRILALADACRNRIATIKPTPAGIADFLLGTQAERLSRKDERAK